MLSEISLKLNITSDIEKLWIENLFIALINSFEVESSQVFIHVLKKIIIEMNEQDFNIFIWNQVFSLLKEIIIKMTQEYDIKGQIEMLFGYANKLLVQQAEQKIADSQLHMSYYHGQNVNLFQSIVSSYQLSKLIEILAQGLPSIGIEACYFCLFDSSENSTDKAVLKLAYHSKSVFKLPKKQIPFKVWGTCKPHVSNISFR